MAINSGKPSSKNEEAWSTYRSKCLTTCDRDRIGKRKRMEERRERLDSRKRQRTKKETKLPKSSVPPIDEAMRRRINEVLGYPEDRVVIEISRQPIFAKDLKSLCDFNWLNDKIVNVYLNLIVNRSNDSQTLPSVYAFNTFFFNHYRTNGYAGVRRWTRRDNIFAKDMLLVPIHLGAHWCMAIVEFRSKQIRYLDSMGTPNDACLELMLQYLSEEAVDKGGRFVVEEWDTVNVQNLPRQKNNNDCGVFALKFADYAAQDREPDFSQGDIQNIRQRMLSEIVLAKMTKTPVTNLWQR